MPAEKENVPDVKVYLQVSQSVSEPMMYQALFIAKSMFRGIGVQVVWSSSRMMVENAAGQHPVEIYLQILGESDSSTHRDTLAYALPYASGVRPITVIYDRIEPIVRTWPTLGPMLFAHVFAHEIAHVLEGSGVHATTGVMKAHWVRDDYLQMSMKPLSFTPADVILIQRGLAAARGAHPIAAI
jgi:hypothetical protein